MCKAVYYRNGFVIEGGGGRYFSKCRANFFGITCTSLTLTYKKDTILCIRISVIYKIHVLSYEPILASLLYTDLYDVISKLLILGGLQNIGGPAPPPPPAVPTAMLCEH